MALIYNETWTGSDGVAWPSGWTFVTGSAGTLLSNQGKLASASATAYALSRMDYRAAPAQGDVDVAFTVTGTSTNVEQYVTVFINGDLSANAANNDWAPGNSYVLQVNYAATATASSLSLVQYSATTKTTLVTSSTMQIIGSTTYGVRFRRTGQVLMGKIWAASGAEPSAWTITYTLTNAVPFVGFPGLTMSNGNTAVIRSFNFDNLYINDSTVPLSYNETWTAGGLANTAWPAPWGLVRGTALVQSGGGQLANIGGTASARVDLLGMASMAQSEILVQVTAAASNVDQIAYIGICCDPTSALGSTAMPEGYIYAQLNFASTASNSQVSLWQKSDQKGSTVTKSLSGGTAYTVRVLRSSTAVAMKVWASSGAEPSAWDVSVAPSTLFNTAASGVVSFGCGDGNGQTSSRVFTFSNLAVYPVIADAPYAESFVTNISQVAASNLWTQGLGTSQIVSNGLRITAQSGDTGPGRIDFSGMAPLRDMEVYTQFTGSVAGVAQRVLVGLNAQTGSELGFGQSQYEIYLVVFYATTPANSYLSIWQGTTQVSGNVTFTATGTTTYAARIRRQNGVVTARVWAAAGAEPTTWMITQPLSSFAEPNPSGVASLGVENGSDGTQRTFTFTNFAVYDINPTLPIMETFAIGATTAAWPAPWASVSGTATLQSGFGQLVTGSSAGSLARSDLVTMPVTGDGEVVARVTAAAAGVEQYAMIGLNSDPTDTSAAGQSKSVIYAQLSYNATATSSSVSLWQGNVQNGSAVTKTLTGATAYNVRIRRYAGTVYVRVWAASVAEPAAWDITAAMTSFAIQNSTGVVSLAAGNGASAAARTLSFDHVSIYDLSAASPYSETWAAPYVGGQWPGVWSTSYPNGAGGIADTQQGFMRIGGGTSANYSQTRQYLALANALTDVDIVMTFSFQQQAESYLGIFIRSDNQNFTDNRFLPSNGYVLQLQSNNNQYYMTKIVGNARSDFGSGAVTLTAGLQYTVRYQCVGTTVRFRMWNAGQDEPTTWTATYADASAQPPAGRVGLTVSNGASTAISYVNIYSLTISEASASVPSLDKFSGTNAVALAGSWVGGTTAGRSVIRGNAMVANVAGSYTRRDVSMALMGDTEVLATITHNSVSTTEDYFWIGTNADSQETGNGNSPNEYFIQLNFNQTNSSSAIQIWKGTSTLSGVVTMTLTRTVPYNVRFQHIGQVLRAKVWRADAAEPTSWTVNYTTGDSAYTGYASMGFRTAGATPVTFTVDNYTVSAPYGRIKVAPGGLIATKTLRVWNGTAWVAKPVKRWSGSAWIQPTN